MPFRYVLWAVIAGPVFLSGCSSTEIKDALYVSGKIAYDTLKEAQESRRPAH